MTSTIYEREMTQEFRTDQEINQAFIKRAIEIRDTTRIENLKKYYKGQNTTILSRMYIDDSKPNAQITHNYGGYITDVFVGYFMGKPVSYSAKDETDFVDTLNFILDYNDEQDHNAELAKDASITGRAYELVYLDEDRNVRLARIEPEEIQLVYDTSVDGKLRAAIRFYEVDNIMTGLKEYFVEVYDERYITKYKYTTGGVFKQEDQIEHFMGDVPVNPYDNNNELMGDFESVITLIDAYDAAVSDKINDINYFTDAYLKIKGMLGTGKTDVEGEEELLDMKRNRVILLDENSDAEFLIKDSNTAESEAVKDRLKNEIHKLSKAIDMSDEEFASNASGVAMKYKIFVMELVAAIKERKFKKGLQRRIELISNYLNTRGERYDYRSIAIQFTRNAPIDIKSEAEAVSMLWGYLPDEFVAGLMSFVDNPDQLIEQRNSAMMEYEEPEV